MDFKTQLSLHPETADSVYDENALIDYVNLKLTSIGQPVYGTLDESEFYELSKSLLASYQEKSRILSDYLPPCDQRIQDFISNYFKKLIDEEVPQLPCNTSM